MSTDRDAGIKDLAYRLWEQDGCPEGKDLDYWLKAEAQLKAEAKPAAKPKAAVKPKAPAKAAAKPKAKPKA